MHPMYLSNQILWGSSYESMTTGKNMQSQISLASKSYSLKFCSSINFKTSAWVEICINQSEHASIRTIMQNGDQPRQSLDLLMVRRTLAIWLSHGVGLWSKMENPKFLWDRKHVFKWTWKQGFELTYDP